MDLSELGWNSRIQGLLGLFDPGTPGRVVRADRGLITVAGAFGVRTVNPSTRPHPDGEAGNPAVGDWVVLTGDSQDPVLRAIVPRTGILRRRRPGAAENEQVIAANVDRLLIVESLERGPNLRRIERAVALAWDCSARPVVVLTKADLAADCAATIAAALPMVAVVSVSALHNDGLDELLWELPAGSTSVVLGPSGVGKSTLINALSGEEVMATRAVRVSDGKGRHTTTHRQLVGLPGNRCVIDTPGVRELGLWLSAEAVDAAFPDVEELASGCRFRDCRHESEPGCAVAAAVADGRIASDRLGSFHRLRRESERLEERVDPGRLQQRKRHDKRFARLVRAEVRRKRR